MPPPKESSPALVAPGIGSANPLLGPTVIGPRSARRGRGRSFSHVHLEVDLAPTPPKAEGEPALERLAGLLREREIVEQGTLLMLAGATLHALAAQGFRRVDHWEVTPGGWLPPPRAAGTDDAEEPVGHLVRLLESETALPIAKARTFGARLSGSSGAHADVIVRRVHRERRHAVSLDLWGSWTKATVKDVEGSLSNRLPVERCEMTKFQYE